MKSRPALVLLFLLGCPVTVAAQEPAEQETGQETEQQREQEQERASLVRELDIDEKDVGPPILDATDQVMTASRAPLTFIEENIPFLTRREIIFFGRLEGDYAHYSSGVLDDDSGFAVRRFRVGLAGNVRFWPSWNYKLEVDLTDGENNVSDAFLSWTSKKWGTVRIGNQKVAQTQSGQASSLSIPFMERPLPVLAFTLRRRLGLGWNTHRKHLGADVTVFGVDPNEQVGSSGWAVRGYGLPARALGRIMHLGFSYMELKSEQDSRFRARPESHVSDTRLVDTGVWADVERGAALGLEAAGSLGQVTLSSEFYRATWKRDGADPKFKGWYVEASWFLTGEQANYRDGKFIRPEVRGKRGAWELVARFSHVDLNDLEVRGGVQRNLAFGVNWYARAHWRFMANLIRVRAKDGPFGKQDPWIAQLRVQYYF